MGTLQNIVGVTRETDAMFKTYYTDENGELVTVSMYNVEDPVSLIGNDVLQATDDYEFRDEDREDGFPPSGSATLMCGQTGRTLSVTWSSSKQSTLKVDAR